MKKAYRIRKNEEFNKAIVSDCDIVFDLNPDIFMIKSRAEASHKNNKLYGKINNGQRIRHIKYMCWICQCF